MRVKKLLSIARAKVFGTPIPVAVGFEITHLCNLACGYCDRHTKRPGELHYEQILQALAGLMQLGMQELSLDGGEPLAHPHIGELVSWLSQHNLVLRMNTNGILVPRRKAVVRRLHKVKISLDGPPDVHDSVRGSRAFERAVAGALCARELGVPVEFTCVIGKHNHHSVDKIIEVVTGLSIPIIFQPVRESLFNPKLLQLRPKPGSSQACDAQRVLEEHVRRAFARVEYHKQCGAPVLNGWASLRHFRSFPNDTPLPCAAGWINLTLDPSGNLYHCGQVNRDEPRVNVVELGVAEAFRRLTRTGCGQCWCARVVEENYAWGGRFDRSVPPLLT